MLCLLFLENCGAVFSLKLNKHKGLEGRTEAACTMSALAGSSFSR